MKRITKKRKPDYMTDSEYGYINWLSWLRKEKKRIKNCEIQWNAKKELCWLSCL